MNLNKCKIKDLGLIYTGNTPPKSERKYYGDKYPLIKPTDMRIDGRYIGKTEESLSEEGYNLFKGKLGPENTPCVVTIGTIVKLCLTKEPSFCNQAVNSIVVNRELYDPLYVFYLMKKSNHKVKSLNSGTASGRENVSKTAFENIEVEVFPLPTQRKIASIISTYDDLIENNTRRIKILEEMAQSLYCEWFVKFRFPGHEKVKMVESELGMVPEGWKIKKLGDIVKTVRISVKPGPQTLDLPYVPIDCLPRKSLALSESKPGSEAQSSLFSFKKYDILFGAMRSYFHKVVIAPFDGTTRSTCFVLRPTEEINYSYAVLTLFEESTVAYSSKHSRGTTIPYAVWDGALENMPIVMPPEELRSKINRIVKPLLERIAISPFMQTNLRRTRDLLLPKLISGEVDVEHLDINIPKDAA